jgi:hypothetical protein
MNITGTGLDSSSTRLTDSHLPALVQKSTGNLTHNSKTDIVVTVVRSVVVANGGTAIPWIIVPGTAPLWFACPRSILAQP